MNPTDRPLQLVWTDGGALERRIVSLACTGPTEELEAHLNMLRRRQALTLVESDSQGIPHSFEPTQRACVWDAPSS